MDADQVKKLSNIFADFDHDKEKKVNIKKSMMFNKYLDPSISAETASRDADEFIKTAAIINGESVSRSNSGYS